MGSNPIGLTNKIKELVLKSSSQESRWEAHGKMRQPAPLMTHPHQDKRKATVEKKRDVRAYATLWNASEKVLLVGLRVPAGAAWQFLSSIVLTAFAFEAYLNHIGPKLLASWEELDRLSPKAKFELLREVLGVKFAGGWGERPLQTLTTLLKFRNTIAHGRSQTLREGPTLIEAEHVDAHVGEFLRPDWEHLIRDADFAKKARKDVRAILEQLHAVVPEPKERLFTSGFATGSVAFQDPNEPRHE